MPVKPERKTRSASFPQTFGSFFSWVITSITRRNEAMVNLKKAAQKGCTWPARPFPAMKVPPQKKAVNKSFRYVINVCPSIKM